MAPPGGLTAAPLPGTIGGARGPAGPPTGFDLLHPTQSTAMALLRVLLNFTHSTDHVLEETAGHVLAGLYGGGAATFPKPPFA